MSVDPFEVEVHDLRDLTFEVFVSPEIFFSVKNVASFRFSAKLAYAGRWEGSDEPKRISQKLYYYLLGILHATDFHDPQQLQVFYQEGGFKIVYEDPEYGFTVILSESGWFRLERDGSSLERFHQWYTKLMPSLQGIIETVKSAVNEEISRTTGVRRSESDEQDYMQLQQAGYEFDVIAYGFRRSNAHGRSSNLDLMMRALTLLPDDHGRLTRSDEQKRESFGRINYSVGRWSGNGEARRREVYQVSAPSNNEWSSLWFTFSYIGDSYISPEGLRAPFVEKDFLTSRGALVPYVDFFRNRALCGFVATLTDSYEFSTTPDILP